MDAQIMSKEAAEAYREQYRKATAKWSGLTFQHFNKPEQWEQHLTEVEYAQKVGAPF